MKCYRRSLLYVSAIVFLLLAVGVKEANAASALMGDVNSNGTVDIIDALLISQYYLGKDLENFNPVVADVNCSETVDIEDGLMIAQYYVNLIDSFPCTLRTEPYAHYPLEGNGNDISGNNRNGVVIGDLKFVTGISGQAGDFDSVDDYINIEVDEPYDITQYTVSAWLQSDNEDRTCAYVRVNGGFHIRTSVGQWDIRLRLESGDTQTIFSGYNFQTDGWHHHVVTVNTDTRTVNFYVDGDQVGATQNITNEVTITSVNFNTYIGQFGKNFLWDGRIDDVRFYEVALNVDEINDMYQEVITGD